MDLDWAKYWQEWAKVFVSILTPVTIVILTYFVTNALNRQQSDLRKSEQILQEKQKTYANIGNILNKIYVYIKDVGDYRAYTPGEILLLKRDADRLFHAYRPYWSSETREAYYEFISACFRTYTGNGQNAMIRSVTDQKRAAYTIDGKKWESDWAPLFTDEVDQIVENKYTVLVELFLNDIADTKLSR